jgi:glucosamine-6-phosphate deaminase
MFKFIRCNKVNDKAGFFNYNSLQDNKEYYLQKGLIEMSGTFNSGELADFLPFRDADICDKVRAISREEICDHPNRNLRIRIIEDDATLNFSFLLNIVTGIKRALDEGKEKYVMILPATNPQYAYVAEMINKLRIPCHHVHTFNMDEYADSEGNSAPRDWRGGFQYWMWRDFFNRIDPELRMPEDQIHFPVRENADSYTTMLEDLGGADICYGGIGWCGHIAFVEPHVGEEVGGNIQEFMNMGTMFVKLHPITVCQNSLYADAGGAGDWSRLPQYAYTIGPKDIAGAKLRSSWNCFGCGDSMWQRFITRLALHGPVTTQVPASILQTLESEIVLSGKVAADCSDNTCERAFDISF